MYISLAKREKEVRGGGEGIDIEVGDSRIFSLSSGIQQVSTCSEVNRCERRDGAALCIRVFGSRNKREDPAAKIFLDESVKSMRASEKATSNANPTLGEHARERERESEHVRTPLNPEGGREEPRGAE